MLTSEKQFNSKSTTDSFDEIYTNYDLAVDEKYTADTGYPFDYPTRWLNDPSMNKRIAVRRLEVTPSSHTFLLKVSADVGKEIDGADFLAVERVSLTYADNLIKVISHMCDLFSYDLQNGIKGGLQYSYDSLTNKLRLTFLNSNGNLCGFKIEDGVTNDGSLNSLLQFLNQDNLYDKRLILTSNYHTVKEFDEVWNRDILYFHTSFSTSRRKFIGKIGDFYQTPTLLYPPPTNESSFYVRFTSNGIKNILIRYCDFTIQLCYIVNYKKATIL